MVDRAPVQILGIDHVQVAAPAGCEQAARAFYGGLLFAAGDGSGGHIGAFDQDTGARQWTQQTDGGVQSMTIMGGVVYGGGHFDNRRAIAETGRIKSTALDFTLQRGGQQSQNRPTRLSVCQ